jgi:hypothetical protein
MKLKIFTTATVFGLLLLPLAHAQVSAGFQGNIPFQFQVGQTAFPAGEYLVTPTKDSPSFLALRSFDGKTAPFMFSTSPTLGRSASDAKSKLVFNRYGSTYFLTQVWQGSGTDGNELWTSKAERAIANRMAALPTPHNVELASVPFHPQVKLSEVFSSATTP